MTIRLAEEHDAEGISATLRAAFAEFKTLYTPPAFSATTPSADQIAERFAEGPIWIAELADTIVGTVATVPKGSELYIRSMAVRPSARGSGIGARLLNTVEAFAAAHRYRRLLLNTAPFLLAAVQLYERHGFRYTGEQPDLFGTQLHTMAKDVSFGILEAQQP
jgi:putative acetyltransferase